MDRQHIILRGGPFTGQIRAVDEKSATFRVATRVDRWATYESTGQVDQEAGLLIFVYNLPPSAQPHPEARPPGAAGGGRIDRERSD